MNEDELADRAGEVYQKIAKDAKAEGWKEACEMMLRFYAEDSSKPRLHPGVDVAAHCRLLRDQGPPKELKGKNNQ